MMSLTFCDVTTLYCQTGGGVRTYYDAKVDWFRRQRRHRYVLVVPGRHSSIRTRGPSVVIVQARGVKLTRADDSYRLFADLPFIRSTLRTYVPDVMEAGDPWVSGPLLLWLRRRDSRRGLVTSFFHSDPISTYVEPALLRAVPTTVARAAACLASRAFFRLQSAYACTMASSPWTIRQLETHGVARTRCVPFGVDTQLFDVGFWRGPSRRPRRVLYAGRLDRDKHVDVLLAILPRLLANSDAYVTIAGTGELRPEVERIVHPRFRYVGYLRDRAAIARLYAAHDVLVAPGPFETFGLAALEAFAAGLMVVGPDCGATGALLHDIESPLMFRAGDAEDLLCAIRRATEAEGQASQRGRALALRHGTWTDALGRLVDEYERMVEAVRCRT